MRIDTLSHDVRAPHGPKPGGGRAPLPAACTASSHRRPLRRGVLSCLCLLLACAFLVACKPASDDGEEESASSTSDDSDRPESGEGESSDDDPDERNDDSAGDADEQADSGAGTATAPPRTEFEFDGTWPDALADLYTQDTVAVAMVRPGPLLDAYEAALKRVRSRNMQQADVIERGLKAGIPPLLAPLASRQGWPNIGLDPDLPTAVFVNAGPEGVLDTFVTLQTDLIRGDEHKDRGAQIVAALEGLQLHARIALPAHDPDRALGQIERLLERTGFRTAPKGDIDGYEKVWQQRGTIVAVRRLDGEHTYLLFEAIATQAEDPVTDASSLLTGLKSTDPAMPAPAAETLAWAGVSVPHVAKLDALYGVTSDAKRNEEMMRELSTGGPFEAISLSVQEKRIRMQGHFAEPQPALVKLAATNPRPVLGGSPAVATLNTIMASQAGPWVDAGLGRPETSRTWRIASFVSRGGPVSMLVPLWLPRVPATLWPLVADEGSMLDPASASWLSVALDSEAGASKGAQIFAAMVAPASQMTQLGATLDWLDSEKQPIAPGKPFELNVAGDVDLSTQIRSKGEHAITLAATSEQRLEKLAGKDGLELESLDAGRRVPLLELELDGSEIADTSTAAQLFAPIAPLVRPVRRTRIAMTVGPESLDIALETLTEDTLLDTLFNVMGGGVERYASAASGTEAVTNLRHLSSSAISYYALEHTMPNGAIRTDRFPGTDGAAVCTKGGTKGPIDATDVDWTKAPWSELQFELHGELSYRYCYRAPEDGKRFSAWAETDTDGDGKLESRYCVEGYVSTSTGSPMLGAIRKLGPDDTCGKK